MMQNTLDSDKENNTKKTLIIIVSVIGVLLIIGIAVWLIIDPSSDKASSGAVSEIGFSVPTTVLNNKENESNTEKKSPAVTTTISEDESYVAGFLAEANTYAAPAAETTTASSGTFFNVVTSGGTVSNDQSLSGLTGNAKKLGEVILAAGFRYDPKQGIFYSETQSWQRNFGFSSIYDAGAALCGMYYDTIRLKFTYAQKEWMFQIWKGRYGITTGGEMGVYYKNIGENDTFYACVPDDKTITMSFALYRGNDIYMLRGPERHWWLTGFKLLDMVAPKELTMHATYFMDDVGMADELEKSIVDLGFVKGVNYQRLGLTMTIIWN